MPAQPDQGAGQGRGRPDGGRQIAVSLVPRESEARSWKVDDLKGATLQGIIRNEVEGEAHIMTDQNHSYWGLDKQFASHGTVDHSRGEYVRGIVHVNFSESYFSLLKRGIFGAFHHISEQHMQRHLEEFDFRWNRRKMTDFDRLVEAVAGTEGDPAALTRTRLLARLKAGAAGAGLTCWCEPSRTKTKKRSPCSSCSPSPSRRCRQVQAGS